MGAALCRGMQLAERERGIEGERERGRESERERRSEREKGAGALRVGARAIRVYGVGDSAVGLSQ